jgi:hypothetical protein
MLKVIAPAWIGFTGLGFYRGVKLYNYTYNYKCIEYEKEENKKKDKKPKYFYSRCFGAGLFGGFIYVNPFILPITISKEIYRLEVNIRGMNEEKEKPSFYEII